MNPPHPPNPRSIVASFNDEPRMKCIIQIPCYNEEPLRCRRRWRRCRAALAGIDVLEYLVIDDGSSDGTAEMARGAGRASRRAHAAQCRAGARLHGRARSVAAPGADIIVNTDADNQYRGEDIARLVEPILTQGAPTWWWVTDRWRATNTFPHPNAGCSGWAAG
jgi:glycosyltransferase involved in cell wall biosynthesis